VSFSDSAARTLDQIAIRENDYTDYTEPVSPTSRRRSTGTAISRWIHRRVEVVDGRHDTFYGNREFIIRDLNRFWVTFGEPEDPDSHALAARWRDYSPPLSPCFCLI
jgi:hypothetical protein